MPIRSSNSNKFLARKVSKVGIVLRPNSPHIKPVFLQILNKLKAAKIECILESNSATMIFKSGADFSIESGLQDSKDSIESKTQNIKDSKKNIESKPQDSKDSKKITFKDFMDSKSQNSKDSKKVIESKPQDSIESKILQNIAVRDISYICNKVDMLFSIGGDGTLLSVARASYGSEVPILGINSGRLGYLTIASPTQIDNVIARIQKGEYIVREHLMLEGFIQDLHADFARDIESKNGKTKNLINKINTKDSKNKKNDWQNTHFFALNEFLLSRRDLGGMLELEAFIGSELFNHYRLDGLLVATPTGSSAYNISAGGSLVYPSCRNVLLTPVCPHALTQRPIILNDEFDMRFKFCTSGILIADGQQSIPISKGKIVHIKVAKYGAMLVELESNSYFMRLRDKFGWGQGE